MYTNEELGFILYNNRSTKGVVQNFLPKLNPIKLIMIENQLQSCKDMWNDNQRMVEVNKFELDTSLPDRKSTRLNSSHTATSRMPSSA